MAGAEGWRRSDRELPPDTRQGVLVWLADMERRRLPGPAAIVATTGEALRRVIATGGRRCWWHPWLPAPARHALRPPAIPAGLTAAWMRPGD